MGALAPGPMLQGRLGAHRVVQHLGQELDGALYEVAHEPSGRRAVATVLPAGLAQAPRFAERFFAAARRLERVRHPGVIGAICARRVDGTLYAISERPAGETLAAHGQRLRAAGATMPVADAVAIAAQVAEALLAFHDGGLVYGGLRPERVFLCAGAGAEGPRVAILALGAVLAAVGARLPGDARALRYRAPEQLGGAVAGQKLTDRTDSYGLGLLLYELLTGEPPFTAADEGVLEKQQRYQPAPRPGAPVPGPLGDLCLELLDKEPGRRPRLAVALERLGALETLALVAPRAPVKLAAAVGKASRRQRRPHRRASLLAPPPARALPSPDVPPVLAEAPVVLDQAPGPPAEVVPLLESASPLEPPLLEPDAPPELPARRGRAARSAAVAAVAATMAAAAFFLMRLFG